jgi:hypothetical protein
MYPVLQGFGILGFIHSLVPIKSIDQSSSISAPDLYSGRRPFTLLGSPFPKSWCLRKRLPDSPVFTLGRVVLIREMSQPIPL